MLLFQPVDHKKIIYQNLNVQDLCSLIQVCRSTKNDNTLRDVLIQKIIDSKFYFDDDLGYPIKEKGNPYPSLCTYEHFVHKYYEKISKISFSDLIGNQISKYKVVLFHPRTQYDCSLDSELKPKIVNRLVTYLHDIWTYKEQNNQLIGYITNTGEYDCLMKSIIQYLCQMFLKEGNEIRTFIFDQLVDLKLITRKGKAFDTKWNNYSFGDFGNVNSNEFQFCFFVETLNCNVYQSFPTLAEIINIGSFIRSYSFAKLDYKDFNVVILYYYLHEIFDRFLDVNDIEVGMNLSPIDRLIPSFNIFAKYTWSETYGKKLFELFSFANYTIENEFMIAYQIRFKRFFGYENFQMITN